MSTLVNYSGDDEFYSSRSFCSDVYCPFPRKRARISDPFVVEENSKKPSIEALPDECLFEIFRRFSRGQERSSAACVSKRWLMLVSSVRNSEICTVASPKADDDDIEMECDGYLTRCLEGKKATDIRLTAISVGTSSRGGLGKLSIRGSNSVRGITNVGLSAISRGCPSLKALSMWNVPSVGDSGLSEIAKECRSLEKLDLSHCPLITNTGLVAIAKNCPDLTSLTIESCINVGNEGLQAIGKFCVKLDSVTIKDCPLVGDQGVASLLALSGTATMLTKVKLHGLNITDFSLAVIGHYGKAITYLTLDSLRNVSQKGFWLMGSARGLKSLASLAITLCHGVTNLSLEAVGEGCGNLKHMSLRKCCFVSDAGLVSFTKAAPCLETLLLEECNRITQTGVLNAVSSCNNLKSLSLSKCMGIKDLPAQTCLLPPCESLRSLSIRSCPGFGSSSLAMVGKLCPKIHQLDLSGLCGITDAGLLPLVESCEPGLAKVNLRNCLNLTDKVVISLAERHGGTLKLLNLDGCRKVTDESLRAIAEDCPVLNVLDVSMCSLTDSGLAALSHGVQVKLQVLSLSGCSMVSNKSLHALKRLGKNLHGLNIQNCNHIGSSTVDHLIENLWRCDILS